MDSTRFGLANFRVDQPVTGVLEDDDVAALRRPTEPVRRLLHQDPVVLDQSRLHRSGGNVEGLHEQRLDEDRQT
jgi:hypothetical protein